VLRDWQFWTAMAAGPLVWLLLYLWLDVRPELAWPFADPLRFALLVAVYPILEEIIFRGLLQGWLLRRLAVRLGPLSAANALTSLVFCLAHLLFRGPFVALAVLAPSLVFGYFRERHRGLAAPIALHCWYNAGYFWLFAA